MPIDDRTTNRNYKLPNAGNFLADDVARLRDALAAIDADVFARYTKTETDQKLADLINGAPGALDTLNELAAAMGDDPNFAATITNALAGKPGFADVWTRAQADARYVQGITQTENIFTGTGTQTTFTLSQTPPSRESLLVTVDGVVQPIAEYTLSGSALILSEAPASGAKVRVLMLSVAAPSESAATLSFAQLGTGAVTRTVESKLREAVSVKDFGAVGNGVANDTTAFQNAANAAGSNGVVYAPNGVYILNGNIDAPSVHFVIDGFLGGAGRIVGDGRVLEIRRPDQYVIDSAFANFKAANQIDCLEQGSHIGNAFSNLALKRTTEGSGVNGPASADYSLFAECEKKDWLTSTNDGEVDALYLVARQGAKSDVGGILIDLKKVRGGDGGATAIEAASDWVNASNLRQYSVRSILSFLEGAGGWSNNTGYGIYLEAAAGEMFSAIHVNGYNDGGPNSPGAFANLLTFYSDRLSNNGVLVYKIDGNGRTYAPNGTQALPSYSFNSDPDTGFFRLNANAIGITTNATIRWYIDDSGLIPATNNSVSIGTSSNRCTSVHSDAFTVGASGVSWRSGTGSPEGVVTAPVGSLWTRTDGGVNTTLYVKQSGTGNTGWAAK